MNHPPAQRPAPHPILVIVGPTAGGKTALATALAERLPGGGECISADSMQVYRGMDIGTAKPTAEEQAAARHHLIDIAEPDEAGFTVDNWLERAERVIAEIRGRQRWPIVVGGTNLYVKALLYGLFDGPEPDPALREHLQSLDDALLRERLERIDPEAAGRIHHRDRKRTIRAIEVFEHTGQPISAWQRQWSGRPARDDAILLGLIYSAEAINRRINARVKAMMEAGFADEVRRLYGEGRLGPQAREALGYKQLIEHFKGDRTLEEAVEQIKIRTRRFAKQQRTWLRRFRAEPRSAWIEADELDFQTIVNKSLRAAERLADTPIRDKL